MSVPRLKKLSCPSRFYVRDQTSCPQNENGDEHRCNLEFALKPHESETLAGVGNRTTLQKELVRVKHGVHVCKCGAKCRVGSEDAFDPHQPK